MSILLLSLFITFSTANYPYSLVSFSVDRGFYSNPFNLTLNAPKSLINAISIRFLVTRTPDIGPVDALLRVSSEVPAALDTQTGQVFISFWSKYPSLFFVFLDLSICWVCTCH